MNQVTFNIEGMHCEACARTIRALLETEPGVKSVDVSFDPGTARILFDPNAVNEARLKSRIEKPGYRVVDRAERP